MDHDHQPDRTLGALATGLLRLSRWKEHILFTVPLGTLGINMAVRARDLPLSFDHRLPAVLLANMLAVTCAFMVNDVEDAPDDARDPARAACNPVACGELSPREGWIAATLTGTLALALYGTLSLGGLIAGTLTVALAYLYSWRGVRLKAWPVVDVVAHVLLLSALLFLAGYFAYDDAPGNVWLVALGVALVSAYGQLYNQVRDYDMDRAAGLHNTASLLGRRNSQWLMYAALGWAAVCLVATILLGLWPLWLAGVAVLVAPLPWLVRPATDMRGTPAIDLSGRIQLGFMLMANVAVLVWLIVNLL